MNCVYVVQRTICRGYLVRVVLLAASGWLICAPAWCAPTAPIVYVAGDGTGDYNCDGTSDQVEINQALTFVANNTGSGYTTVYLKGPRTYTITDSVKIGSNTTLTGDATAVIKLVDHANWASGKAMVTMIASGNHDITVTGFEINGNDTNNYDVDTRTGDTRARGQSYYTMLSFSNVTRLYVYDMYIHDNMNDGLRVSDCSYVYYHDNQVLRHGHDGLYAYTSSYIYAYNNTITIRTNSGIRFSDSNHCKAYDNTISKASGGGAGFEVQRGNNSTVMDDIEIYNNVVNGTAGAGVWIFGNATTVYTPAKACNVRIHNNVFYSTTGGIQISGFYSTYVENNVFDGCGNGIYIYANPSFPPPSGGTGYNTIVRNNIISNGTIGVYNRISSTHSVASSYNCFFQNSTGNFSGSSITTANELLNVDPLYANRTGRDYHLLSKNGRLSGLIWVRDAYNSPCIDAGYPAALYGLEPAPNGGRVNIGAYGNTAEASKSPFTLSYTAGAGGSVTGTSPQKVNYGEDGSAVTANASSGYFFLRWSDGIFANPRLDADVVADHILTAVFSPFTSPVWVQFGFGGLEDGTQTAPFSTLDRGIFAVTNGGTVRILAGSTASGARITKPLRLESSGGIARIGR